MNEVRQSGLDGDGFVEAVAHRVKSVVGARAAICRKSNSVVRVSIEPDPVVNLA